GHSGCPHEVDGRRRGVNGPSSRFLMPRLSDRDRIRTILRRDPVWSVYALGDLAPRMFEKTTWFAPDLTLVLHDYGTSILFAPGTGSVREALDHATSPVHLQVQADALAEIARY